MIEGVSQVGEDRIGGELVDLGDREGGARRSVVGEPLNGFFDFVERDGFGDRFGLALAPGGRFGVWAAVGAV